MSKSTINGQRITLILEEYCEEVEKLSKKNARAVAREAVEKLKATSPKRSGEYAGGWKVTKKDKAYIVHNAKKPGLTHLLEYGHVVRNGKGRVGHANPHPHIASVEEWANQEYQDRMERDLQ